MNKDNVILRLAWRITELERRLNNMMRPAKVKAVYPDEHRVRLTDGNIDGPKIPWVESSGGIGTWAPPTVDQQMIMFSPYGDLSRAFALGGGFGENTTQPSGRGDQHVLSRLSGGTLSSRSGELTWKGGAMRIKSDLIIEGSVLTHNGIDISARHEHIHPPSGTAFTGPPKG